MGGGGGRWARWRRARWPAVGALGAVAVVRGVAAILSGPEVPPPGERSIPPAGLAALICSDRGTRDGSRQLFRIALDGRVKERILGHPGCVMVPQPDGTLAGALPVDASGGRQRLARLRADPYNPRADWTVEWLAPELDHVGVWAAEVPAQGGVVFTATDAAGWLDLYRLLPESDSVIRLTRDPWVEADVAVDPVSPDGPVVYRRFRATDAHAAREDLLASGSDVYAVPLAGGTPRRLTTDPPDVQMPRVRGGRVVYVRGAGEGPEEGSMELMLLDLETLEEEALTRNDWNDLFPSLSRDGRRLCWQSEEFGHYEMNLRAMDLETREERILVSAPGRDTNCFFTPDGRWVLFTGYRSGDAEVYMIPWEGGADVRLTHLVSHDVFMGAFLDPARLPGGPRP